jgi:nucleoside 2-deoxyribosyltransferase
MRIFLISPVRHLSAALQVELRHAVEELEAQGHEVHWPFRDTEQAAIEWAVCERNMAAMAEADLIYVAWRGHSEGVLFDLGVAFALGKAVRPLPEHFPGRTPYAKSIANLVHDWAIQPERARRRSPVFVGV